MHSKVAFLFIKKNRVLLEYRKNDQTKADSPIVPKGEILPLDSNGVHANEVEHALHRLIYTYSSGTLIPLQYELMKVINDQKADALIYTYFIYAWDGEEPTMWSRTAEETFRLRFLDIDDALMAVTNETDGKVLKAAKETIRIRSVLHGRFYH